MTLAKALGGGLPLGAVVTGAALEGVVKPGHHGTTFGGNPVACRLAAVVIEETEKLLGTIQSHGEWFGSALRSLDLSSIVDVRGAGMMWGIKLDVPYRFAANLGVGVAFITDPWGTSIELNEGLGRMADK